MKNICPFIITITMVISMFYTSKTQHSESSEKLGDHVTALIVVDVQNCFIIGNLALINNPAQQDAAEVVPIINNLIQNIHFDVIVYTYDWHPQNHISFYENLEPRRIYLEGEKNRTIRLYNEVTYNGPKVRTNQVLWPSHCVQNTSDAELHKDLHVVPNNYNVIHLRKGLDPDIDSYSAFADNNHAKITELHSQLQELNVTRIFIAGLATDYCVAATALDAARLNYTTYLVEDASRGVDLITINRQLERLKQNGVHIITTNLVKEIMSVTDDL